MPQVHHTTTSLPYPGTSLTTRERYASSTPAFKRPTHQHSRSPPTLSSNARRHAMNSMTSVPTTNICTNVERGQQGQTPAAGSATPPLDPTQMFGKITLGDGLNTIVKPEPEGQIDKGFFQSEGNWTCYRRNYFSCNCSFSMSPSLPANTPVFFKPSTNRKGESSETHQVFGWAMSISAVVSENYSHNIELVQHTPKRDKGPTHKPEKIPMQPKTASTSHHHHALGIYGEHMPHLRAAYADAYGTNGSAATLPSDHLFERIQFKQATQNNGKRRAAQQYYHLMIELYADIGNQGKDRYIKVATRRSAPMIVRGRSPGHYQTDRRGSQSTAVTNTNGYTYGNMTDFLPNVLSSTGPDFTYDTRSGHYMGLRANDMNEHSMSTEEERVMVAQSKYPYYPHSGTSNMQQQDRNEHMQPRSSVGDIMGSRLSITNDGKVKGECDFSGTAVRSPFQPHPPTDRQRCGPYDGKGSSNAYFPAVMNHSVNFT